MNKYTQDEERRLVLGWESLEADDYDAHELFIIKFAIDHKKSKRSVIAKLSIMKKYISRPKISKVTGGNPETKVQIRERIRIKLGGSTNDLDSLEKSSKLALLKLMQLIEERDRSKIR